MTPLSCDLVFAARRQRFLERMGPGAVAIVQGARLLTRSADTEFPFRQDSDFHYLTGFDHPHAVAVLRTDGGPAYTLFVEPRDRAAETWTGYRPGVEGAVSDYGADEAFPADALDAKLPALLERAQRLLPRARPRHAARRAHRRDPGHDAAALAPGLRARGRDRRSARARCTRCACARSRPSSRSCGAPRRSAPRRTERPRVSPRRDASSTSSRPRCSISSAATARPGRRTRASWAAGATRPSSTTSANDQKLTDGELVLIDAGCELDGYASDVTRTYPVGGQLSRRGARGLRGGARGEPRGHGAARSRARRCRRSIRRRTRKLVEGMVELGLLAGGVDELIRSEAHRRFYMHNTSHWLGLDVHDVGAYAVDGGPRVLEPGMVFTIEPGLYIAADDMAAPARAARHRRAHRGRRGDHRRRLREPDRGDPEASGGRRSLDAGVAGRAGRTPAPHGSHDPLRHPGLG